VDADQVDGAPVEGGNRRFVSRRDHIDNVAPRSRKGRRDHTCAKASSDDTDPEDAHASQSVAAYRLAPMTYDVQVIGRVESALVDLTEAPRQGDEGAPDAWLVLEPAIILLTWLHHADRTALRVHPRGDSARRPQGVFSTRSPDRPNPIGLHEVTIAAIERSRVQVRGLEAVDGTPVIDIKPVLGAVSSR
jgi:tRNA (Thr-GGU) A37 N-methylase